ncbi:MAG: hypothetical protein B0D96_00950 [Candidatus Sedimenticola endophacoides]|nr:MAG: hypothetical protein B0D94_08830 [Candidatus Sedimenticola endophacoides]OQX38015.1 MAG: hypothetical protein B0D96_00950 [Candidatus Sedimenticola endophacoides]OQX38851.1 MAG: hypothetical protein B0D89_11910 [Candidatus Sedimenticola endophacoides]OQX43765.1 MAG: hypothetical protein B0D88_03805 [Candidatus Sedimenticola endophacoides]OQX44722.1 MAG: hypothetical protein B0D86_05075 [Candidatus Sedimenticola endophacoides]
MPILRGVSIAIPAERITAIVGPPGCGKSTLVDLICGYARPDSGDILFEGRSIAGLLPTQIAAAGLVRTFEQGNLYDQLTVADHLILSARNSDVSSDQPYQQWRKDSQIMKEGLRILATVGLTSAPLNTRVGTLSPWQRKRLDLALVLLEPRSLVFWEEPMQGLSEEHVERIRGRIARLRELEKTVVLTTADECHATRLADQVIDLSAVGGRTNESIGTTQISEPEYR